jgi:tungstate transport system substrate-binding protein
MYNDFVIVGPEQDPARIHGLQDAAQALQRIARQQQPFVSRGDDSGTHKKEKRLWQAAGISPRGNWYRQAGQGMGKVLQIAGELDAYTLTDRGTWLYYQDKSPLQIQVTGDPRLYNPYGVIAVNPARYPDTNYEGAMRLIAWLTSPQGQRLIADYRIHDQQLFTPLAVPVK